MSIALEFPIEDSHKGLPQSGNLEENALDEDKEPGQDHEAFIDNRKAR